MAGPIGCDEGDGLAAYVITRTADGDVTALCDGHFVAFVRAIVAGLEAPASTSPESEPERSAPQSPADGSDGPAGTQGQEEPKSAAPAASEATAASPEDAPAPAGE